MRRKTLPCTEKEEEEEEEEEECQTRNQVSPVSRARSNRRLANNATFEYNLCDFKVHTHHT